MSFFGTKPQAGTLLEGHAADQRQYVNRQRRIGEGKTLILIRLYKPGNARYDLGMMRGPVQESKGIAEGEVIQYDQFDTRCVTSPVSRITKLSATDQVAVYAVDTSTGSRYQVVILL